MKFQCGSCKTVLSCDDSGAGLSVICTECGKETAVPAEMFAAGTVIDDFVIREHIADGDIGRIYLAYRISTGEKCALKIISPEHTYDAKYVVRFIRDGRFAVKHKIRNTVDVYSVGEESGIFYYAMEYVEGVPLSEVFRKELPLPVNRAVFIVEQIAEALSEAWKSGKIVHRSIKPDNILIMPDGSVKLSDYGLARDYLDLASRSDEDKLRLVQYVSPECLFDFSMEHLGSSSDIYSLGAVFYHAVTGRYPHDGFMISEIISGKIPAAPAAPALLSSGIPESVSQLILKMLSRRPEDRFQNPEEFLDALRSVNLEHSRFVTTQSKPRKSVPDVTVKMKRGAANPSRKKITGLNDHDSKSRLDIMRKEREARSQTIILMISLSLLVVAVFFVLFIRWLVYEPQASVRKMELNIARMKEQAEQQKNIHLPLKPGSPELLCRGVVAFCSDEDFASARRYLRGFSKRFPVDPALLDMLTYHVNNASVFFRYLCYSGGLGSGMKIRTGQHGICQVTSVQNAIITAKTVSGELLQFPIRSMSAGEYMEYLHTVAKKFDMNVQMRSYLICTGNFKTALSLASAESERSEFEQIAYSYIRSGIVNATPTEIRQLRMLYGSLEPFQRAMRTNLQHKHNLENEK